MTAAPILSRLDRDTGWLAVAAAVALRADCRRRQVGALLVSPDETYTMTGRNGLRAGGPSCLAGDCPRGHLTYDQLAADSCYTGNCAAIHAEVNAVAAADPDRVPGATLYITHAPCPDCAAFLARTALARIVWPGGETTQEPS